MPKERKINIQRGRVTVNEREWGRVKGGRKYEGFERRWW